MRKWILLTLLALLLVALFAGCVNEIPTTAPTNTPTTAPTTAPATPPATNKARCSVTLYNYDGTELYKGEVPFGGSVDMSQVTIPEHPYRKWYTFSGWDKSLENITEDLVATVQYDYNSIPEEIFEFVLLEDDTYGIRLADQHKDYAYLNLEGYVGFPEEYNGKPVTRILKNGVENYFVDTLFFNTTDVLVPSSYRIIEDEAFVIALNRLTIAEGVEELWAYAFDRIFDGSQKQAPVISLPSTLKLIEPCVFPTSYVEVEMAEGDVYTYHAVRKEILTDNGHTLVWKNVTDVRNVIIDKSITKMYPGLFCGMEAIEYIEFQGDITQLPVGTVSSCWNLQSLILPYGLEKIWGPEQIPELQKDMHSGNDLDTLRIGQFIECWSLNVSIPETVTHIGDYTFYMSEIISGPIVISKDVEYIGISAFGGDVPSITVDAANTKYYSVNDSCLIERGTGINGGDTFMVYAYQHPQTEFAIPEGVTTINPYAFNGAYTLKSLTVPEGVETLPVMFAGCKYLYDENWNFMGYSGLEKLSLPSTLKTLEVGFPDNIWGGVHMFGTYPCAEIRGLKELVFPNGCNIEVLPMNALFFGDGVQSFTFSKNATVIEGNCIYGDNIRFEVEAGNEKYISINGSVYEKLGDNKLKLIIANKHESNTVLDLTDLGGYTLVEIADTACYYNQFITKIILPEGLEKIGTYAFGDCPKVTEVVLPSTLKQIGDYAFYGAVSLQKLSFRSQAVPAIGTAAFFGYNQETFKEGFLPNISVYAPAERYFDYFEAFYAMDPAMAEAIITQGVDTYTYTFVENGGSDVSDIADATYIYTPPYISRDGYNFLGWYTKDGANGDWGERINFYIPYCAHGDATLYARWSETERFEDGAYFESAFYFVEDEARSIQLTDLGGNKWLFSFTAKQTGIYDLVFDMSPFMSFYWDCIKITDGNLRTTEVLPFVSNESGERGFYVEEGQTVYFICEITAEDLYSAAFAFTVQFMGEYTGDKWWEMA